MSAIHGIVRFDGKPVERREIEGMVAAAPYRGPDGESCFMDGSAAFAHQAFHVTPESVNERQPQLSPCGRWLLLADIRLDNREELAGLLGLDRERARQMTDPDYVMEAWLKWREQCPQRLLGAFVFAVWDRAGRELFLARDSLGEFGLVWGRKRGLFLFSSEIEPVLDHPAFGAKPDEDTVLKSLVSVSLSPHETHWSGVRFLQPAHTMLSSPQQDHEIRYWNPAEIQSRGRATLDECRQEFLQRLRCAVSDRMRSNGAIGVSLSGGNDSTLVAAVAAEGRGRCGPAGELSGFSYVFDRYASCDERRHIQPVLEHLGLAPQYIPADDMLSFRDFALEPPPRGALWTNCYVQLPRAVSRAAAKHGVRVLLDGQFGDSLLAGAASDGNAGTRLIRRAARSVIAVTRRLPAARRLASNASIAFAGTAVDVRQRALQRLSVSLSAPRHARLGHILSAPKHSRTAIATGISRSRHRAIFGWQWPQVFALTRGELYNRYGLEAASPLFDRRLAEFVLSLQEEIVSTDREPRRLQRAVIADLLPRRVFDRSGKTSFEPLLTEGLAEFFSTNAGWFQDNARVVQEGWIDQGWWCELPDASLDASSRSLASQAIHLERWLRHLSRDGDGSA